MKSEFETITLDSLDRVIGGKSSTPPTPPPPRDDSGKYCKDGMKVHYGVGGHGKLETPLGLKVEGDIRYDQTECK